MTSNSSSLSYFELGKYSRIIKSTSPEAQLWFDRGLVWLFGYNHEEAINSFNKALNSDPNCAMAHWGIAYSIGPNYNKPWEAFEGEEKPNAVKLAAEHLSAIKDERTMPVEHDIIRALSKRYPVVDAEVTSITDFMPFHNAYADAMREVYENHPKDLEVCFLFAEALMNRTPWQLWNLGTGLPADGADTAETLDVLEGAFKLPGSWKHPGLLHMYIHLMEMSPHPEKALRHGNALCSLVPDSGHLIHMSTHIDVLCGDYEKVVSRNHAAILADRKFVRFAGADNFYSIYRCHNYHFKIYGAMFLAQPGPALEAADQLIENLPEDMLRPMADWLEAFIPMKQHVLVRFGRWSNILDQKLPQDEELYCVTTALMRYARTVALANMGNISAAETERDLFYEAKKRVPESRNLFENTCQNILQIAEQMMLGELEYHKGNHDVAFEHLRRGVYLSDHLNYDEPWGWMQPVRHALGALLLEQRRFEEAETVYREDLGLTNTLSRSCQHPNNVWSLHGLHECLVQRGEKVEVIHVKLLLDRAAARAQVPITASCFCRRKTQADVAGVPAKCCRKQT